MRYIIKIFGRVGILLFATTILVYAQEQSAKNTFRVTLDVSGSELIKSEVTSYISRELRSLTDIVLVDSDPDLRIEVVALASKDRLGNLLGYTLSIVVAKRLKPAFVRGVIHAFVHKEGERKLMLDLFSSQERLVSHSIVTGADLQGLSKKIVADIDGEVIEAERKEWQSIIDDVNKELEKKPLTPNTNNQKKPES